MTILHEILGKSEIGGKDADYYTGKFLTGFELCFGWKYIRSIIKFVLFIYFCGLLYFGVVELGNNGKKRLNWKLWIHDTEHRINCITIIYGMNKMVWCSVFGCRMNGVFVSLFSLLIGGQI